jgi:glycerol-3-phosphate dehydrogenase subunit C
VAIYVTYVNFNEPGIGHDLLALLTHNEIPYVLVTSKACCGMPLLKGHFVTYGLRLALAGKKNGAIPI